jgi:exopolysaccharide biosynthesis predicted pyruvyltransferase EpsI
MPLHAFEFIPRVFHGKTVCHFINNGNVGDQLIWAATAQLFAQFGIRLLDWSSDNLAACDIIAYCGGGNMGGLYPSTRERRESLLQESRDKPIVILPQSYWSPEDFPAVQVFVRERQSLRYAPAGAELAPDLALGYTLEEDYEQPRHETGIFLRGDVEGNWPGVGTDPVYGCGNHRDYLKKAARYAHVITDRLHFAVAGLHLGRRVTLLPGSYFKNRAFYEDWLAPMGCLWVDQPPSEWLTWHKPAEIPERAG